MIKQLSFLFILTMILLTTDASGQFGVRAKYNSNNYAGWDNFVEGLSNTNNDKLFATNLEFGADYWFRLKDYRVEFLPEAFIGLNSSSTLENGSVNNEFSYAGINFNTQLYLFDLKGDCDCPTFSKQGPTIEKGLFLNIAPGVIYGSTSYNDASREEAITNSSISVRLGVGVGFDIGISDLFTITPMVNYSFAPGITYNELEQVALPAIIEHNGVKSELTQLQFALRLGFRPDYAKSYGRGRR